jgi:hypothetical protein
LKARGINDQPMTSRPETKRSNETRVVSIKKKAGVGARFDIYIGRRMAMGGWNLPESVWHNPFRVNAAGLSPQKACGLYEKHIREKIAKGEVDLETLRGKTLGCWCRNGPCPSCGRASPACPHEYCHGDVLVRLLREAAAKKTSVTVAPTNTQRIEISDDDAAIWEELGWS